MFVSYLSLHYQVFGENSLVTYREFSDLNSETPGAPFFRGG